MSSVQVIGVKSLMLRSTTILSVKQRSSGGRLLTPFLGLERVASDERCTYQKLLLGELNLIRFFRASFRCLNNIAGVRIP
jgi:hypothetical protein